MNILLTNKVELVEWLSSDHHIVQLAHSDGIITTRDYRKLRNKVQPEDACIRLIDTVIDRGEGTSAEFLELLKTPEILNTYPQLKEWNSSVVLPGKKLLL